MNGTHTSEDAPPRLPFFSRGKTGEKEMSHTPTKRTISAASTSSNNPCSESDGNMSENSKDSDMEKKVNESCINSIHKTIILLFSQDNLFDLSLTFIL